jgi:hypothetical protein
MYLNGDCVIAAMSILKSSLTMEEIFPNKGILEKLTGERKRLAFYIIANKLKP